MSRAGRGVRRVMLVAGFGTCGLWLLGTAQAAVAAADPPGTIFVGDLHADAIDVFAAGASGNVAPIRQIVGSQTGLSAVGDVKVDAAGDVYASNSDVNTITEYAPGASGDATPLRTISGASTQLCRPDDLSLEPDGTLVVGQLCGTPVLVFGPGASGNVAPERTLTGQLTGQVDGVGMDATGALYADLSSGFGIQVYAPGASGNATPERTVGATGADDVIVGFNGQVFATTSPAFAASAAESVVSFPPGAGPSTPPTQDITGSNTDLRSADDLAVAPDGTVYVSATGVTGLLVFSPGATGNISPSRLIMGSNVPLQQPEGVALQPPPAPTLQTSPRAPTISVPGTTSDTATITGTAPTGSIVFNLYGPSDPACTGRPAYTSPPVTVAGNGSYSSPSFAPTQPGSYAWVAEYSGDSGNAPATGACTDQSEQVVVAAAPKSGAPVGTKPPTIIGQGKARQVLRCQPGSWTGNPTKYTYQWYRDGTPLAGATSATYTVQTIDEGTTLTCVVIAANSTGSSQPATSGGLAIAVPVVHGCPRATGALTGDRLGLAQLGMTRAQATHAYTHSSTRGRQYEDFFCLTPIGVRVGYASPKLLAGLSRSESRQLQSQVVWASTSNPYYAIAGIRPGATLAAARHSLPGGNVFPIGLNDWYVAHTASTTAVLKVRHGIVEEIGIADPRLTRTTGAERALMHSFY